MLPRRSPLPSARLFHSTTPARSALFNLGGLAASREGQYLSRERGIPRTEYSSNIHLIRSSEVDPFAPAPGATRYANAAVGRTESPTSRTLRTKAASAVPNATPESKPRILLKKSAGEKGKERNEEKLYILEAGAAESRYRELTNAELTSVIKALESKNKDHHKKIYFLLFTTMVLGLVEVHRQWESVSAPEHQAQATVVEPPAQGPIVEAEGSSAGKISEQAVSTEGQLSPQTSRNEQHPRGFMTSLFWSSRRGS